ncbi:hypothetical protein ACI2JA_03885 [Alkalihalobacillus sp. NPDC078783]
MKKLTLIFALLSILTLTACSTATGEDDKDLRINELTVQVLQLQKELEAAQQPVAMEYELKDIAEGTGETEYYFTAHEGLVLYGDDVPEGSEIGGMFNVELDPNSHEIGEGIKSITAK